MGLACAEKDFGINIPASGAEFITKWDYIFGL